jgi:hypothetical protein
MASLDSLPADERAVLQLVLQQRRSYDEIARMLSIDRGAVRSRALAALNALGPQTRVPPQRCALITDYLLGQLPEPVSDETRDRLAGSAAERAWARVVVSEIAPLAGGPLPEIPAEGVVTVAPEQPGPQEQPRVVVPGPAHPDPAHPAPSPPLPPPHGSESKPKAPKPRRSSRFGGVVLLGGTAIVVLIVLIVVVVASGSGGSGSASSTAAASVSTTSSTPTSSTPTTSTSSTAAKVVAQINLLPPTPGGKAAGIAEVLNEGANDGIAIVAQDVPPNTTHPPNAYAVWLYNSPSDTHILGFVNPGVGKSGRISTASGLPTNASRFKQVIITEETTSNPKTPGKIILQGPLSGL